VSANAESHGANIAGAFGMRLQVTQRSLGVRIVAGQFFIDFVCVPSICSSLVVWKDRARFFQLMKYFWNGDDESVPGQHGSSTSDRSRHLKDFGEQDYPRVTPFRDWV
jgi:hypothetical protein